MNSAVRCFIMDCSDTSTELDSSDSEFSDFRKQERIVQNTSEVSSCKSVEGLTKNSGYKKTEGLEQKSKDSGGQKRKGQKKNQGYRQTYRVKWESEPDFKGWLKAVPGQPTRAYCSYCKRTLHAHFLSLLKHTCTMKHTKAAQITLTKEKTAVCQSQSKEICLKDATLGLKSDHLDNTSETTPNTEVVKEKLQSNLDSYSIPPKKISDMDTSSSQEHKFGISTHVLDTAKGCTVSGLHVSLYKLIEGKWTLIAEGFTNSDGRYNDFVQQGKLTIGRYKLHYDVGQYFELNRQESLYPFVEIVFDVKSPLEHHHVPLLLAPFGYSTYRGS